VNHDDTDANDDNWIVCGGIPGNAPAVTFIGGETDDASGWNSSKRVYFWLYDEDDFFDPRPLINDLSGTADVNSSGGAYQVISISTANNDVTKSITLSTVGWDYLPILGKRELAFLVRLYDEGSNLQVASLAVTPAAFASDFKPLTTTTAFRLYLTPFISVTDTFRDYGKSIATLELGIRLKRSTGTANVRIDYVALIRKPVLSLVLPTAVSQSDAGFYYENKRANTYDHTASGDPYRYPLSVEGDIIELKPDKLNTLIMLVGDATFDPSIARVLIYTSIIVTPRWSLL
jgi:hypothetical protein